MVQHHDIITDSVNAAMDGLLEVSVDGGEGPLALWIRLMVLGRGQRRGS
jgi:hypothetical protein